MTNRHSEESSVKPCRACSDFTSWMKAGPTSAKPPLENDSNDEKLKDTADSIEKKSSNSSSSGDPPVLTDQALLDAQRGICPPDRGELGSATWNFLHSVAAYFPAKPTPDQQDDATQLINIVSRLYPCSDCADDLRADIKEDPPKVSSSIEFSQWMCRQHNKVNVKLGKPVFDCTKVFERWRDGWKDGSCD